MGLLTGFEEEGEVLTGLEAVGGTKQLDWVRLHPGRQHLETNFERHSREHLVSPERWLAYFAVIRNGSGRNKLSSSVACMTMIAVHQACPKHYTVQ